MKQRRIERTVSTPRPAPGFAGPGHTAVEVVTSSDLAKSDPFVLLMDDRLDFADGQQLGGAHPHAGLETVTLVLEGALRDRDEGDLRAGDAVWMTAGRGLVHNEHVEAAGWARILQLWITMPKNERSADPRFEVIRLASLPIRREPGVEARLYSGTTGTLRSRTLNHVPVTLVDFALEAGAVVTQELRASYNGFLYVTAGSLRAGDDAQPLAKGDVGWLDRSTGDEPTTLQLTAGPEGARVVLYAGEPQREAIIQHGPFVATSQDEIARLFREYRAGRFERLSNLTPRGDGLARPGNA
jgi:redox-sensitive bicupin YhaK (pirin superfamily)